MLLAGDIGGTKTHFSVYQHHNVLEKPLIDIVYTNKDFLTFEDLLNRFFQEHAVKVTDFCLGVAGPVKDHHVDLTNLKWKLSASTLKKAFNFEHVALINDLEAIGYGIEALTPEDYTIIHPGKTVPHPVKAIIASGTGLGQAIQVKNGPKPYVIASEGGHVDFGPLDDLQIKLMQFLRSKIAHISYEHLCSGIGVMNLFEFLQSRSYAPITTQQLQRIYSAPDPAAEVFIAASQAVPCLLCKATCELFIRILGAASGNLALTTLCKGGLYIGGGIPRRIAPLFDPQIFMQAFLDKGRMSFLLKEIPIYLITSTKVATLGAALYMMQQWPLDKRDRISIAR